MLPIEHTWLTLADLRLFHSLSLNLHEGSHWNLFWRRTLYGVNTAYKVIVLYRVRELCTDRFWTLLNTFGYRARQAHSTGVKPVGTSLWLNGPANINSEAGTYRPWNPHLPRAIGGVVGGNSSSQLDSLNSPISSLVCVNVLARSNAQVLAYTCPPSLPSSHPPPSLHSLRHIASSLFPFSLGFSPSLCLFTSCSSPPSPMRLVGIVIISYYCS